MSEVWSTIFIEARVFLIRLKEKDVRITKLLAERLLNLAKKIACYLVNISVNGVQFVCIWFVIRFLKHRCISIVQYKVYFDVSIDVASVPNKPTGLRLLWNTPCWALRAGAIHEQCTPIPTFVFNPFQDNFFQCLGWV